MSKPTYPDYLNNDDLPKQEFSPGYDPVETYPKELGLLDKVGARLFEDDVVYYGDHYYRLYLRENGEIEMFACTFGYEHDITPDKAAQFKRVGTFPDLKQLLACD